MDKNELVDEIMNIVLHTKKGIDMFDRKGDYFGRDQIPDYDRMRDKIERLLNEEPDEIKEKQTVFIQTEFEVDIEILRCTDESELEFAEQTIVDDEGGWFWRMSRRGVSIESDIFFRTMRSAYDNAVEYAKKCDDLVTLIR